MGEILTSKTGILENHPVTRTKSVFLYIVTKEHGRMKNVTLNSPSFAMMVRIPVQTVLFQPVCKQGVRVVHSSVLSSCLTVWLHDLGVDLNKCPSQPQLDLTVALTAVAKKPSIDSAAYLWLSQDYSYKQRLQWHCLLIFTCNGVAFQPIELNERLQISVNW